MRDQTKDSPANTQLLLLPEEVAEEQRMLELIAVLQDPTTMQNISQLIALQQENTRRRYVATEQSKKSTQA